MLEHQPCHVHLRRRIDRTQQCHRAGIVGERDARRLVADGHPRRQLDRSDDFDIEGLDAVGRQAPLRRQIDAGRGQLANLQDRRPRAACLQHDVGHLERAPQQVDFDLADASAAEGGAQRGERPAHLLLGPLLGPERQALGANPRKNDEGEDDTGQNFAHGTPTGSDTPQITPDCPD